MAWRPLHAAAVLMCVITAMPMSYAQSTPAAGKTATDNALLNFVGADIESVVKAVGQYTNTTYIVDPRVKGTITLVSEKPVSRLQAQNMLASTLRLQGFVIVAGDGFSKIVPEADAKLQAGPTTQVAATHGDQIASQVFHLEYESANNLVSVLRPLIAPNNTINSNPDNNTLIITDYVDNLKRLGKIIASLDTPATSELDVVPVKYAIASDVAILVTRLLETGSGGAPGIEAGRVNLLTESRTNSIIIRAPSAGRASLAKSLIAKLDQPTAQPGNVHVVYLRNADATKLAQTLRAVMAGDTSNASAGGGSTLGAAPGGAPQQGGSPSAPAAPTQGALPAGGATGFIQADSATNTLIITANETMYRNLRAVIDQLDARRAQVYIESLIVEVSAEKAAEFGVQWLGLTGDSTSKYRIGGGTSFSTGGNNLNNLVASQLASKTASASTVLPGNGLSLGLFQQIGGTLSLGAIAHMLESDTNANILSVPNLITLDNEEARIIVGQNVPFITGQFTGAASGAGANPFQTVERKDIGLSLRVRPQISEGGTVKMSIYQETSAIQNIPNPAGLITSKRSIETNVLVDDGQIIVLGGLMEDNVSDGAEKVRGLGDIPLLGELFKYRARNHKKTNLMVFLRPVVIRNSEQSIDVVSDRYDYIRNAEMNGRPEDTIAMPHMDTPLLPMLQHGAPTGSPLLKVDPTLKSPVRISAPLQTKPEAEPEQAPAPKSE